jgi:hypothetical protein
VATAFRNDDWLAWNWGRHQARQTLEEREVGVDDLSCGIVLDGD